MTERTREWAVVYRLPGVPPSVWAVIDNVPAGESAQTVRAALSAWSRWPSWQRRIGITGRVGLVPSTGKRWAEDIAPVVLGSDVLGAPVERLMWEQLAPVMRRVSTPVTSELWAEANRAAAELGVTLADFVRLALIYSIRHHDEIQGVA